MKSKSCGNCDYFTKYRNDIYSGGICDFYDKRTNTDCGKKCESWKGIKYNRNEMKRHENNVL